VASAWSARYRPGADVCRLFICLFIGHFWLADGVGVAAFVGAVCAAAALCAPGASGWPGPWGSSRSCELPAPAPAFLNRKNAIPPRFIAVTSIIETMMLIMIVATAKPSNLREAARCRRARLLGGLPPGPVPAPDLGLPAGAERAGRPAGRAGLAGPPGL